MIKIECLHCNVQEKHVISLDLSLCVGRKQQLKTELSGHVYYRNDAEGSKKRVEIQEMVEGKT